MSKCRTLSISPQTAALAEPLNPLQKAHQAQHPYTPAQILYAVKKTPKNKNKTSVLSQHNQKYCALLVKAGEKLLNVTLKHKYNEFCFLSHLSVLVVLR